MAKTIETQGLTIDEAVQVALNQLGASRDQVEIEIVHDRRGGFLGIGARRAKIRATLREEVMSDGQEFDMSNKDQDDRGRRRRGRGRSRGGRSSDSPSSDGKSGREGGEGRSRRGGGRRGEGKSDSGSSASEGKKRQANQEPAAKTASAGAEGDSTREGGRSGRSRRRGRGGRGRGGEGRAGEGRNGEARSGDANRTEGNKGSDDAGSSGKQAGKGEAGSKGSGNAGSSERGRGRGRSEKSSGSGNRGGGREARDTPVSPEDLERLKVQAHTLITEMLTVMGFDAEVITTLDPDEQEVVVRVESEAEGLLIGRRGQTLDALEHIVHRMVLRGESGGDGRVLVDIGGYRERRRQSLAELAERLRVRAVTDKRTVQLSPMSPRDRRFFHQSFTNDPDVDMRALGSGFYRRVAIVPKGLPATGGGETTTIDIDDPNDEFLRGPIDTAPTQDAASESAPAEPVTESKEVAAADAVEEKTPAIEPAVEEVTKVVAAPAERAADRNGDGPEAETKPQSSGDDSTPSPSSSEDPR